VVAAVASAWYRAFKAQLASHTIGETFGRAAGFLKLAAADTREHRHQRPGRALTR
jgi:hypothetical protein